MNKRGIGIIVASMMLVFAMALAGCSQGSGGSASSASASGSSASAPASASASASESADGEVSYTLKVDASAADKGTLYEGSGTIEEGKTVYDALVDTGLELAVSSGSGTVYVDGIGDVVASKISSTSGWTYTVNGEMPSDSADQHKVSDGDVIEWTFIKG